MCDCCAWRNRLDAQATLCIFGFIRGMCMHSHMRRQSRLSDYVTNLEGFHNQGLPCVAKLQPFSFTFVLGYDISTDS